MEERFKTPLPDRDDYRPSYYYHAFAYPRMPVITQENPEEIRLLSWGLIPHWVKTPDQALDIRSKTHNARSETLAEKPSFSGSLATRRCLVIARGFYEWQNRNGQKVPWYIRLKSDQPFAFAGLYDEWTAVDTGEKTRSFSIITTAANPLMAEIHNTKKRMPVMLPREYEQEWLNPGMTSPSALFYQGIAEKEMEAYTISPMISRQGVEKNTAELIKPYAWPETKTLFQG